MAGLYPLAVNESLTVPTRRPDLNGTVIHGNLAQCKPVVASDKPAFPGQYPAAAVDGFNGTVWRPSLSTTSYIVVDLEEEHLLSGAHINWGDTPAVSFQINAGNDTKALSMVASGDVALSAKYDEALAAVVELRLGNVSDVRFTSVGRHVLRLVQT